MDIVWETFDSLGAREIKDNCWLLAGPYAEVGEAYARLLAQFQRDISALVELHKSDLVDQGLLTEEEINHYREQAAD
jgi:hypothetical protein